MLMKRKNNDGICQSKTENIELFNRWQKREQKRKSTKMCAIKSELEVCKHYLEPTQVENNSTRKNKVDADSLRKNNKEFLKSNKLILKSKQIFRIEKYDVFTEKVKKIAVSANDDDEIIQSINLIETYAYGTTKDLICKKDKIKWRNTMKKHKTIDWDYITKKVWY